MTILCGTDLSENASQAERAAAALASRFSSTLRLLHVSDAEKPDLAALGAQVEKQAAGLRSPTLTVEAGAVAGMPDEALVAQAEGCGATALVVSFLGRRAARWRIGGIAERTAQTSPVPVLVVKDSKPFEAWASGGRTLRVVVALDQSDAAEAAIAFAVELRKHGPCELVFAHVYFPPDEKARLGLRSPVDLTKGDPEIERLLARDLEGKLGALVNEPGVRLKLRMGFGAPAVHLARLAVDEQADLLVVGLHQRSITDRLWHGSVSRAVLHEAETSVACVPARSLSSASARPLPRMRRVLATTDLSPLGNRSIPYAASLAGSGGAVKVLHVVHSEPTAEARTALLQELRALVPSEAQTLGIDWSFDVVASRSVVDAICQAAERAGADALCISSHGRSTATRLLLGSVAEGVLSHSRRPVLVLRPQKDG